MPVASVEAKRILKAAWDQGRELSCHVCGQANIAPSYRAFFAHRRTKHPGFTYRALLGLGHSHGGGKGHRIPTSLRAAAVDRGEAFLYRVTPLGRVNVLIGDKHAGKRVRVLITFEPESPTQETSALARTA